MQPPRWNRAGLVLIWAAGVLFWTWAAARGLGEPALHALPFGIVQMGVAAVMAVGVWYLTALVPWTAPLLRFATAHLGAIVIFALGYAAAQGLALLGDRSILECLEAWAWLGGTLLNDGKPAEAKAALEQALADRKDFWWARQIALPQATRMQSAHAIRH